jgi:hypothetical protein
MRRLPRPNYAAGDILASCIASVRDPLIVGPLRQVIGTVQAAEAEYLTHALAMALHAIAPSPDVGGIVTGRAMKKVYAQTFVKCAATRPIYHALKAAPANDICPLCAQRTVSTLDHYLAQSIHANLTVVPLNLVPACAECNKNKLAHQPVTLQDQSFHPYFDDFDDACWLIAEVVPGTPAAVRFEVAEPETWSAVKIARAKGHFRIFKLGSLYASHAGVELANVRHSLEMIYQAGTAQDVRAYLADRAVSARFAALNSWQAATYEALAGSDWFCAGGFNG